MCAALGIEWEPEMANPYESAEATKSFRSADGRHIGDPKLLRRSAIDARQADKWRTTPQPEPLRQATRELAGRFGCALPPPFTCPGLALRLPCTALCIRLVPEVHHARRDTHPPALHLRSAAPV